MDNKTTDKPESVAWEIKKSPFEVYNVDHGALTHHVVSGDVMVTALYAHHESREARIIAAAPDLLEALVGLISITKDSTGVAGYHLNGDTAEWDEFEEVDAAIKAIDKAVGAES